MFKCETSQPLCVWKKLIEAPQDDKTYLVCWKQADGTYSSPHRAYYLHSENNFFSLENNNSHPIVVDIYMEYPDPTND